MLEHAPAQLVQPSRGRDDPSAREAVDFAAIYQQHRLAIYRYVLARVGHVEDAQDITAQVFPNAYRHVRSYRGRASIIHWLIGIARHHVIDHYRSTRQHDLPLDAVQEHPAAAPGIEETLVQRQRLRRVSEAINALSEDRREAISLRLFAGLTNPEIAEVMGKSAEAVAMLVHRGIQDLRLRLSEEELQ